MTVAEARFESILGAQACRLGGDERIDGVPVSQVLRPESEEQVAACLAEADLAGVALIPSGGGSKLGWGNRSRAPRLVRLDLSGLREPLELEAAEGIVTAAAGVPVASLAERAAGSGQRTLLCALHENATVGGTIASDPPGLDLSPGWRLRNDLLGLRVAYPDGSLGGCGGRVVKNVTGFDLVRLHCGAFGTLGVITRATLRLRPLPEETRRLVRRVADAEAGLIVAAALQRLEPRSLLVAPVGDAAEVLWEFEGHAVDVTACAAEFEGEEVAAPRWQQLAREAAGEASRTPDGLRVRVMGRPSDTLRIWRLLSSSSGAAAPRLGLPLAGIVFADLAEDRLADLSARARKEGWLTVVERASPDQKRELDVFGSPPADFALMAALKRRFDPRGTLSPGRFVGGL